MSYQCLFVYSFIYSLIQIIYWSWLSRGRIEPTHPKSSPLVHRDSNLAPSPPPEAFPRRRQMSPPYCCRSASHRHVGLKLRPRYHRFQPWWPSFPGGICTGSCEEGIDGCEYQWDYLLGGFSHGFWRKMVLPDDPLSLSRSKVDMSFYGYLFGTINLC